MQLDRDKDYYSLWGMHHGVKGQICQIGKSVKIINKFYWGKSIYEQGGKQWLNRFFVVIRWHRSSLLELLDCRAFEGEWPFKVVGSVWPAFLFLLVLKDQPNDHVNTTSPVIVTSHESKWTKSNWYSRYRYHLIYIVSGQRGSLEKNLFDKSYIFGVLLFYTIDPTLLHDKREVAKGKIKCHASRQLTVTVLSSKHVVARFVKWYKSEEYLSIEILQNKIIFHLTLNIVLIYLHLIWSNLLTSCDEYCP